MTDGGEIYAVPAAAFQALIKLLINFESSVEKWTERHVVSIHEA